MRWNTGVRKKGRTVTGAVLALLLGLTWFAPMRGLRAEEAGMPIFVRAQLFLADEKETPLNLDRETLNEVNLTAVGNPSEKAEAYLPVSAFASRGVKAEEVSSKMLPADFVYDANKKDALNKTNEEMAKISVLPPEANELLFRYDAALTESNLLVSVSGYKLKNWGYANYEATEAPLSDGSVLIPANNVGDGLVLKLYFDKEKAAEEEPVEIEDRAAPEGGAAAVAAADTAAPESKMTASFENLRTLLATLENYLPNLPNRNGYRASLVLRQTQQMVKELRGKGSTSAEQDMLTKADQLISKTAQKLKVTSVVNLPSTGENGGYIYIILALVVLALALVILRAAMKHRR